MLMWLSLCNKVSRHETSVSADSQYFYLTHLISEGLMQVIFYMLPGCPFCIWQECWCLCARSSCSEFHLLYGEFFIEEINRNLPRHDLILSVSFSVGGDYSISSRALHSQKASPKTSFRSVSPYKLNATLWFGLGIMEGTLYLQSNSIILVAFP